MIFGAQPVGVLVPVRAVQLLVEHDEDRVLEAQTANNRSQQHGRTCLARQAFQILGGTSVRVPCSAATQNGVAVVVRSVAVIPVGVANLRSDFNDAIVGSEEINFRQPIQRRRNGTLKEVGTHVDDDEFVVPAVLQKVRRDFAVQKVMVQDDFHQICLRGKGRKSSTEPALQRTLVGKIQVLEIRQGLNLCRDASIEGILTQSKVLQILHAAEPCWKDSVESAFGTGKVRKLVHVLKLCRYCAGCELVLRERQDLQIWKLEDVGWECAE
mmetsp:Transcript_15742/g.44132  ORF Transcript_15742/g.44132 Transcript_15742/m.44132 type:complete len:269 (-) Transcript_15742:4310-5116(-)